MLRLLLTFCFTQMIWGASATDFHNETGRYILHPLPDATLEQKRMDNLRLSDQQPFGRYVKRGDYVEINTEGLTDNIVFGVTVGFRPMWGQSSDQQLVMMDNGQVRFRAEQDGPLFFKLVAYGDKTNAHKHVKVNVSGAMPLPLYVEGQTTTEEWKQQLSAYADAPFVQLLSKHSMITLPMADHKRQPITDPRSSLAAIDKIIEMEDELAGFDSKMPRDEPSPLRRHFLVDFIASKDEPFYMYATDEIIGLRSDNFTDLTDPVQLHKSWGIWHELGHTYQQNSWTWDGIEEVSVNLFSLYIQEKLGQPSRLSIADENGISPRQEAVDYVKNGGVDFMSPEDPFVKLVMFEQLKDNYGWELFTKTFRHFREYPQHGTNKQQAADSFVKAMCQFSGNDLRPYFNKWGLHASEKANRHIDALQLPPREQL